MAKSETVPAQPRATVKGVFFLVTVVLIGFASGCHSPERELLRPTAQELNPRQIERVLRESPIKAEEALHPETLLISDACSVHLLQFRTGEQRHIHRQHDLTFLVHKGRGDVFVRDVRFPAKPGDVFHIPRNTPHHCTNTGDEPLVAVLIFTPPFDRKDSIPLPREARSYPAEPE